MPERNASWSADDAVLNCTVHLVDDDASFRTALERRLRKAGYDVATYPTAEQFLNNLPDRNGIGCVLLDLRMPGMSGRELQTQLGRLGSTLPILFLTGCPDIPTPSAPSKPVRRMF